MKIPVWSLHNALLQAFNPYSSEYNYETARGNVEALIFAGTRY